MKYTTCFYTALFLLFPIWIIIITCFILDTNIAGLCYIWLVFCMLLFAVEDYQVGIIEHKWWLVFLPPGVFGLWFAFYLSPLLFALAVIPAIIIFVLGWFRVINGADVFGIIAALFCCAPFSIYGIIPLSWIIIAVSFVISAVLYFAVKAWRGKGVRYLVPLFIAELLGSIYFLPLS